MSDSEKPSFLKLVVDNDRVKTVGKRGSYNTLEKVLRYLQEHDPLFDYNVPRTKRDPGQEGLLDFLIERYAQKEIKISGGEAVQKYLRCYDFVEFADHHPLSEYKYYIKPGMKGIILRVDQSREYPLTILWEQCDEFPKGQCLDDNGERLILLSEGPFWRKQISAKLEILAQAAPGRLVKSNSREFSYLCYIPIGAKGIATEINSSEKFPVTVVFGNTEGYIPPPSDRKVTCLYSAIKIIRKNKINLKAVIRELV